jgi:hypothetical protein
MAWDTIIGKGTNDGKVHFPRALTVASSGILYVSDSGNAPGGQNRIQAFQTNGQLIAVIGNDDPSRGGLLRPGGLVQYSNTLYLADTDNNRVMSCNLSSTNWSPLTLPSNSLNKPEDVAQDLRWLFVSDTLNNRIVQFVVDYGPSKIINVSSVPVGGGNVQDTEAWDAMPGWRYDLLCSTNGSPYFPVTGMTNLLGTNGVMTGQSTVPASLTTKSYGILAH